MTTRCGYVGIVGRPNVGKSTLLNRLVGQKISITAPKPQTTRHQILGIVTDEAGQAVFVDTPGLHTRQKGALNRYLNRAAASVLEGVDLVLFVVQAGRFDDEDRAVLARLRTSVFPLFWWSTRSTSCRPRNSFCLSWPRCRLNEISRRSFLW